MVIEIEGYKRIGLPEDWKESMTIGELMEHFNLLAKDAKKVVAIITKLEEVES